MKRSWFAPLAAIALAVSAAVPMGTRAAPDFDLPAAQLRIALDRVLAEHAFLIIQAMRTGVEEGDEFEAAFDVLESNTLELIELVDTAYGDEAADAFAEQWRNHIAYLVDYARAEANDDSGASAVATSQLELYVDDFSALLVAANPGLPADVVEDLIDEHIQQLEQIGSLADSDFSDAYAAIAATYDHMFMVGDGLTLGIVDRFGERFPGRETAFSPAVDLRITLDRLFGEHTYLAAIAMRAALGRSPDLEAAVGALDANSGELAREIDRIYGDEAGSAFDSLWRSHTGFYLEYISSVADGDDAAADAALASLGAYRADFSAFLAGVNPNLDAQQLEELLEMHTGQLVDQVTAYEAGDYAAAYGILREAYAHTELLAAGLGGAIADQFPQQFPDAAIPAPAPVGGLVAAGWLLLVAGTWLLAIQHRGGGRGRLGRHSPCPLPNGRAPRASAAISHPVPTSPSPTSGADSDSSRRR